MGRKQRRDLTRQQLGFSGNVWFELLLLVLSVNLEMNPVPLKETRRDGLSRGSRTKSCSTGHSAGPGSAARVWGAPGSFSSTANDKCAFF